MIRYLLIALILHLFLFLNISRYKTLGDPNLSLKTNIPISYNSINIEQRIDNIQKVKGGKETEPESYEKEQEDTKEKEIEKKVEKIEPEIKSKMSNNKEKKEVKKQEKKKKKAEKPVEKNPDDVFTKNGNFTANLDGTYTAISSKGINFEIITQVDPDYPRQAEIIRYNKSVTVEVRFLVDLNGNIENIEILKSHEKFGFDKEVLSALKKWKFKPIVYNGRKIKVYFNKEFVFNPKS